jgi:hypothetical protein
MNRYVFLCKEALNGIDKIKNGLTIVDANAIKLMNLCAKRPTKQTYVYKKPGLKPNKPGSQSA